MKQSWWNDYVGIPFADKGRTREEGLDCWGLLRLVNKEQFDRDLPSFAELYTSANEPLSVEEAIAQQVEGWEKTDAPVAGDGVLLRIDGRQAHVGVATGNGTFLHAWEGTKSTIERLDAAKWRHRVQGFYRYTPTAVEKSVVVQAIPHPFQTRRIRVELPPNMSLATIAEGVEFSGAVGKGVKYDHLFMIDGKPVPTELLASTFTRPGQRLEYRAVPRGNGVANILLTIAVLVVAWYAAPAVLGAGYGFGAAGWAAASAAGASLSAAMAAGAIGAAGMMLSQSIFPTRLPNGAPANNPNEQFTLTGGQNRTNQYGSIPAILGQHKFTPPVGAIPYNETLGDNNYLRLILVWGYGPLQINDVRIGANPIESLEEVEYVTLNGWDDTPEERTEFNRIYGQDVSQDVLNQELLCPGNKILSAVRAGTTVTVNTDGPHEFSTGANVSLNDVDNTNGEITVVDADTFTIQQAGSRTGPNIAPASSGGYGLGTGWVIDPDYGVPRHWYADVFDPDPGVGLLTIAPSIAGKKYTVTFTMVRPAEGSGPGCRLKVGGTYGVYRTKYGTWTETLTATDASGICIEASGRSGVMVHNVSIRRLLSGADANGALSFDSGASVPFGQQEVPSCFGSNWIERVISDECDRISITLNFPKGLYKTPLEGSGAGGTDPTNFRARIEIRQLDSATLAPIEDWTNVADKIPARSVTLQPAWFNIDSDAELEKVYRWTRLSLSEENRLVVREGAFTTNPNNDPTGALLTRLQNAAFGVGEVFERLPDYEPGEEPLWDVCMYGDAVYSTVDRRGLGGFGAEVTGCALTTTARTATIAAGTILRAQATTIRYGASGEKYSKRRDPFTVNYSFDVPRGKHEVRVKRTNESNEDFEYPSGNKGKRMHACYLVGITGFEAQRPIVAPKGTALAMTAIRVRATNQINGSLEGISATVQTICKDYDWRTASWTLKPTRNPASLMRHVLQHPGNMKRVPDAGIDIPALEDFHNYCRVNGFMFDQIRTTQRSVLDTIKDICAAGRASPTMRDGKWTVVIDRPRTEIVQHFTPHNSWGFEGTRLLPKVPHAFRVKFNNAEKGYQADELVVYNDGYSEANATIFEGLEFPGVTTPAHIFKHARFHLAQLRLRPETYVLNADFEHIVCTRGDLVRVTHDVPMWGLASGRIKERIDASTIVLDEPVPMDAGKQYTIRIRTELGTSVTKTIAAKGADGYYDTLAFTAPLDFVTQANPGNLFMFGELASESVELIVMTIEPSTNMTARIRLADYSPAIYDSDTEVIPPFDSQITLPPILQQALPTIKPAIGTIISDESVMLRVGNNQFDFGIKVNFTKPSGSQYKDIVSVEGQIDYAEDTSLDWSAPKLFPASGGNVMFRGVEMGAMYRMRLRFVDRNGRAGPWTYTPTHVVVGKKNPPATPTGLDAVVTGTRLLLDWNDNTEPDILGYEVRSSDADWGKGATANRIKRGTSSQVLVDPPTALGVKTWYVKSYDTTGNFCAVAGTISFNRTKPVTPTGLTKSVSDTSTTIAQVTFNWNDMFPTFGLKQYRCELTLPGGSKRTSYRKSSDWTTDYNWIGDATLRVSTIDLWDVEGDPIVLVVNKALPNRVAAITTSLSGNKLLLDWAAVAKTSLPIAGYEVRSLDSGWGTAGYLYRGLSSQHSVSAETLPPGTTNFYVKAFDTDGQYSEFSRLAAYVRAAISDPSGLTAQFTDTSTTDATVKFNWLESVSPFGIRHYVVTLTLPDATTRTVKLLATEWVTRADWIGTAELSVTGYDNAGHVSAAVKLNVTMNLPANVGAVTKSVLRSDITLDWGDVIKTTLPVAGYEVRTANAGWGTAGYKYRGASSVTPKIRMATGVNTYYIRAYDTDGNYSAVSATVSHTYSLPPNLTGLTLTRKGRYVYMESTGPAAPSDLKHYEFRIKRGVTTGDVWDTGYDTVIRSQSQQVEVWTPTQLGSYRVAVRMVDQDGNVAAASALANIDIPQIPAP